MAETGKMEEGQGRKVKRGKGLRGGATCRNNKRLQYIGGERECVLLYVPEEERKRCDMRRDRWSVCSSSDERRRRGVVQTATSPKRDRV